MTEHPCVTTLEPELRSCLIASQHEDGCDGLEYRWNQAEQDEWSTGLDCPGCRPRVAIHGFVCGGCYKRIMSAMEALGPWMSAVAGIERTVTPERGSGGALGFVPIPALQLDLDALHRLVGARMPRDVATWVSTRAGAVDAVQAASLIQSTMMRHPVRVEQENLDRNRCPKCERLTLVKVPPAAKGGAEIVKCRDWACDYRADDYEVDLIVFRERDQTRTEARA